MNAMQTSRVSSKYIIITSDHSNINHFSNMKKKYLALIKKHELVFRLTPPLLPQNGFI